MEEKRDEKEIINSILDGISKTINLFAMNPESPGKLLGVATRLQIINSILKERLLKLEEARKDVKDLKTHLDNLEVFLPRLISEINNGIYNTEEIRKVVDDLKKHILNHKF